MKRALVVTVIVVALIQLIPVERDNPANEPSSEIVLQGEVKTIIQVACYDCHSYNTNWPWYSYVAPVSWLVAHDVSDAREELNFSVWNTYSAKKMDRKFREIVEEVEEEEMPLPIYLIMHSEADLDVQQREIIINWARSNQQEVSDSIINKDTTTTKINK